MAGIITSVLTGSSPFFVPILILVHLLQIVDDMKFTVSHVVEPVERGIAKINRTFHEISKNVKRHEERRRGPKDDSYLIPLNFWTKEFPEVDDIEKGSFSDSNLINGRRQRQQIETPFSQFTRR